LIAFGTRIAEATSPTNFTGTNTSRPVLSDKMILLFLYAADDALILIENKFWCCREFVFMRQGLRLGQGTDEGRRQHAE
jgi:hypothetical protein